MRIGFIGGGNMAGALIVGLADKLDSGRQIHVVDLNQEHLKKLEDQFGVGISVDIDHHMRDLDVIVLAVKPQQMHAVALKLAPFLDQQIVLTVAAGIRAADLSRWLNGYARIVRTMPNTPAMVGQGMSGLYAMDAVNPTERQAAESIMQAVGQTLWVEQEHLIDSVTAISGSGPAYVFYFIEALQEAAQQLGFNADQARQLSLATFQGAAQLAMQSEEPVHLLRERVTSKGGTTFAALCSMDASHVKTAIHQAAQAAAVRAAELGDEFGQQ
ncbi:pyrroline-5-carboxylate reductase [Undibacterium sp. FT137W]|uniref:Pyrroline-5-carboxylate reductase n=2 Tax=Undibacterium fentianense TaxID=2828728 RepID=A0A941E0G8_9BURK|nr:pyrroline-5-carboxylate reductase [Undibacterium fentianense]